MASGGVTVKGLKETIRTLEKFGVQVADLKAAFRKIGQNVTDDAQNRVPSVSGALSTSIKPSNTKNKSIVRAGSARVPYAGVQNWGWPSRNIVGTQFLNRAVEAQEGKTKDLLEEEIRSLIRRYGLND